MLMPATIGSNDGAASFSSSLELEELRRREEVLHAIERHAAAVHRDGDAMLKRSASAGVGVAELGDVQLERHDRLLDRQRAERMERDLVALPSRSRSVTIARSACGELASPVARVVERGDELLGDVHRRQAGPAVRPR